MQHHANSQTTEWSNGQNVVTVDQTVKPLIKPFDLDFNYFLPTIITIITLIILITIITLITLHQYKSQYLSLRLWNNF